jgi:lipoyl(octanoyl) transferase
MFKVNFTDLGLIEYKSAWDIQQQHFDLISENKLINRKRAKNEQVSVENRLYFCEHPHVYTLGKHGEIENLLLDKKTLEEKEIGFYKINRGGDITYHGPGQIVGYPIFDLDTLFTDIGKFLRLMEEAIILTLAEYEIKSGRIDGLTGVWLDKNNPIRARKICAMGMHISRWVTMHGFALNVNSDVDFYQNIVPCGIQDKGVTSMQNELGYNPDIDKVKTKLLNHLQHLLNIEWIIDD